MSIEIEENAVELYSQMTTLLLSWQIARHMGKSQAGSIKKTARKLMNETKCPQVYETFKKIARCQSDFKVVEVARKCLEENKRLGYL